MTDYSQAADAELVKLALRDKEYFIHLMDRYEAKLLRYIRRLTGLKNEYAEDILQEVFIKIYKNLNNFNTDLKFSSWAYRITHNETINHIKKIKGKETISLENDDGDKVSLIDILMDDTDVKENVAQNEQNLKVREILFKLPTKYRDVLVLKYLEDKDYSEISDILKKPMGTVATLVNRAKAKFKKLALSYKLNS